MYEYQKLTFGEFNAPFLYIASILHTLSFSKFVVKLNENPKVLKYFISYTHISFLLFAYMYHNYNKPYLYKRPAKKVPYSDFPCATETVYAHRSQPENRKIHSGPKEREKRSEIETIPVLNMRGLEGKGEISKLKTSKKAHWKLSA